MAHLKAFREHTLVSRALGIQKRAAADAADFLAASMTYYGFLSLFPLLLLGLSILGYLLAHNPSAEAIWASRLSQSLPGMGPIIGKNIAAVARHRASTGVIAMAGLMWSGLGIVEASRRCLGRIFRLETKTNIFKQKMRSMGLMAALGLLFLLTMALTATVSTLRMPGTPGFFIRVFVALLSVGFDFLLFIVSYRVLIWDSGPPWKNLIPGALLGAVGLGILKIAGTWYAKLTVVHATAVYGTFASTIGALILLLLAARIYLYGAETNAYMIEESGRSVNQSVKESH